jgi:hypothetical protein
MRPDNNIDKNNDVLVVIVNLHMSNLSVLQSIKVRVLIIY